jgi:hypothetical protein
VARWEGRRRFCFCRARAGWGSVRGRIRVHGRSHWSCRVRVGFDFRTDQVGRPVGDGSATRVSRGGLLVPWWALGKGRARGANCQANREEEGGPWTPPAPCGGMPTARLVLTRVLAGSFSLLSVASTLP